MNYINFNGVIILKKNSIISLSNDGTFKIL